MKEMEKMEIVFVASEMTPFAHSGGLGDVVGALPHEIAKLGHSVSVFIPKYKSVSVEKYSIESIVDPLNIPLGSEIETGRLLGCRYNEINVFFVDEPSFFNRDSFYGTPVGD
jgi:starch synthase